MPHPWKIVANNDNDNMYYKRTLYVFCPYVGLNLWCSQVKGPLNYPA